MRRAFYWVLPVTAAAIAMVAFAAGFISYLRGDVGEPVTLAPRSTSSTPPRGILSPLVMGDSLARGAGDEAGLGISGRLLDELHNRRILTRNVANIAINGARTADVLQQLESHNVREVVAQANVIVLSIGGNDLWTDNNWRAGPPRDPERVMATVLDRVDKIVRTLRQLSPKSRIFVIGLYNPYGKGPVGPILTMFVNRWNAMLTQRFANDPNVVVVETYDIFAFRDRLSFDRFHPKDEGYAAIARRIADAL
ncbi:MAG TPA: GDSL-type esterase/lipase family protein [Thermoanaerobaculia bacterium]|nr:GDSL-type esterase/lipase family protein [Thermoanaerobaculia bacterium]